MQLTYYVLYSTFITIVLDLILYEGYESNAAMYKNRTYYWFLGPMGYIIHERLFRLAIHKISCQMDCGNFLIQG